MARIPQEWLETDGLGGFASGTVEGRRSRRYHALLLTAAHPPTGRFVLVNGVEVQVTTPAGTYALSSQHYVPNVRHPNGDRYIKGFTTDPWPTWTFQFPDGTIIQQEFFVPHRRSAMVLSWKLINPAAGLTTLSLRPLISGRDYHALHLENAGFCFHHDGDSGRLVWRPYVGVPGIIAMSNGHYSVEPLWFRQFLYAQEQERGLDCQEDLASPGVFRFEMNNAPATCVFTAEGASQLDPHLDEGVESLANRIRGTELTRRRQFSSPLHRAADQYFVRRDQGQSIIAGYPWFTDWGRDTFISMRGFCLASRQLDIAGQILTAWSRTVSAGMVPNRFPDTGDAPEYQAIDASLWFVLCVGEYLNALDQADRTPSEEERSLLFGAVQAILNGYDQGTRYQIGVDPADGLVRGGVEGVQLTWMDAKVGDWVVTPRIGKPVEIQALWVNALEVGKRFHPRWSQMQQLALENFQRKFWNPETGCLHDVVDANHVAGAVDSAIRPNQIFAVGGLPVSLVDATTATQVVRVVEETLWTPKGLRTLSPNSPDYHPGYQRGPAERDAAYHQGTVWPWLTGAWISAWLKVEGNSQSAQGMARRKFLDPMRQHLKQSGLGHISEIFDAEPTESKMGLEQIPRGCPFQAWSLAEFLRIVGEILPDKEESGSPD